MEHERLLSRRIAAMVIIVFVGVCGLLYSLRLVPESEGRRYNYATTEEGDEGRGYRAEPERGNLVLLLCN